MFTGLIEEVGKLQRIESRGEALLVTVSARKVLEDVKLGDSIAVNGVCLTVVSFNGGGFSADVMPETYRHTNLKHLKPGEPVNLERAMLAGGRFGGHIVQGHVDGTALIVSRTHEANAVVFRLRPEQPHLLRLVVPQGSITLDGISLTVIDADRTSGTLAVSIIPHTLAETALANKQPGASVNVENDILGKYIDHLLHERHGGQPSAPAAAAASGLTEAKLREFGF
ncbi:riboflavin synthase alpha chain [Cohnella sp. OV330]|uniref:riboflavin synthase n=1 Tax=Cohnella sp. OV330 TaxID=1855288 RepID=UPI0008EFE9F2|nr:riboflavin synthase [Cohnella sp. OV330]SFB19078.1 riboflavin synthase alpha chain [Cohnella sp. OV330]